MFSHTGDSVILTCTIHIVDVPSLVLHKNITAHVGSCIDSALGPRGCCLTSGRYDLIVNLFDTNKWIAVWTITICECVEWFSSLDWIESAWRFAPLLQAGHLVPELLPQWWIPHDHRCGDLHRYCVCYFYSISFYFSWGWFRAIIILLVQCATETGVPLHQVPTLSQLANLKGNMASLKLCDCILCKGGPAPVAMINLFGLGPVDALCRSATWHGAQHLVRSAVNYPYKVRSFGCFLAISVKGWNNGQYLRQGSNSPSSVLPCNLI